VRLKGELEFECYPIAAAPSEPLTYRGLQPTYLVFFDGTRPESRGGGWQTEPSEGRVAQSGGRRAAVVEPPRLAPHRVSPSRLPNPFRSRFAADGDPNQRTLARAVRANRTSEHRLSNISRPLGVPSNLRSTPSARAEWRHLRAL